MISELDGPVGGLDELARDSGATGNRLHEVQPTVVIVQDLVDFLVERLEDGVGFDPVGDGFELLPLVARLQRSVDFFDKVVDVIHHDLQLDLRRLVGGLLEDGIEKERVLGEPLHGRHEQVAEPLAVRPGMRLGPLDERVEEIVGFAALAHVRVARLHVETVFAVGGEEAGECLEGRRQANRIQRFARRRRSLQDVPQILVPKPTVKRVNVLNVREQLLRLDL